MSYRPLELSLISAKDINKVNLFSKMEVYAVAMVAGDPRSKKKTHPDRDGGRNPNWNATFSYNVMDFDVDRCVLHVLLKTERVFGDREVGEVHVPVRELLDGWSKAVGVDDKEKKNVPSPQFVSYQVRKPSGKAKGTLNLSYKFGDLVTVAAPPPPQMAAPYSTRGTYPPQDAGKAEPVTAYPATGPSGPYQPAAYPPQSGYGYPPPTQAGYPPPQAGYGYPAPAGYPPQQPGYGYPTQQQGYGYPPPQQAGYGYPPQQGYYPPQQQQGKKFGGAGLGLGAGLLGGAIGGMILGDMVSDGFDDGFGF